MDKEKSAVEAFLEGTDNPSMFEQPSNDPFETKEVAEVKSEEVVEGKEEKSLPFHKDPKVQKFIEKEIEKRLENIKPIEQREEIKKDDDDYWERLIGNDTTEKLSMIKEAKAREERLLDQAEERTFNRLSQKEQEEAKEDAKAEEELNNAFENIEESYDVDISSNSPQAKKTRQDFISFVEKIAPKDRYGEIVNYPDMPSAWEAFSEIKKSTAQPNRAKELASRGLSRSAETTVKQEKRVDWNAVDEMMDSMK